MNSPGGSVFIRNLSLRGKHGVGEAERNVEQEFLIDIEADIDLTPAAVSDDLSDTANYVDFADVAKEAVEKNSFYLIEKLATRIADKILADSRIKKVSVTIRKPSVLPSGVPGISIVRSR